MNVERILQGLNGIAGMIHGYVVAVQVYSFKRPGTRDWRLRKDGSADAARRGVGG